MSGIAGIFNIDGRPVDKGHVQAMSLAIAHRGSDDDGIWVDNSVGLAHRMLRTTPESLNEQQPTLLDEGNFAITCDGRIDNREELIGLLRPDSPICDSIPDSELILKAYVRWGVDSVTRLVGDFAFAIWDKRRNELFCARDPIGLRMFNYYFDGRRFVFGSELKELLVVPGIPQQINERKVALWLNGGLGDAEQTFYEGINRLPGGYYLIASRNGIVKKPYWNPDPSDQIIFSSHQEYVDRFQELFRQSVKSKMRGINPAGVWLSGGLDSSSVFCMAEEIASESNASIKRPEFFSAVFPGLQDVDESEYIDSIAEKYGSQGFKLSAVDMWTLKQAGAINKPKDEPLTGPTEAWEASLARQAASQGINIVLTGEGGDQLFHAWDLYLLDTLRGLHLKEFLTQIRYVNRGGKRQIMARYFQSLIPWKLTRWKTRHWGLEVSPWIRGDFQKKVNLSDLQIGDIHVPKHRSLYLNGLDELINARGRHVAYSYLDMMGAECSVEFRHPFWDRRLIEFLIRTPAKHKYASGQTKLLMRDSMVGVLPEKIRRRRSKPNFGSLFDRGIAVEEKARIKRTLEDPLIGRLGYVDVAKLRSAAEQYGTLPNSQKFGIFMAITLEEWLKDSIASNGSEGKIEQVSCPPK